MQFSQWAAAPKYLKLTVPQRIGAHGLVQTVIVHKEAAISV